MEVEITTEQLNAALSAVPEKSGQARQLLAYLIKHTEPTSHSLSMGTGIRNLSNTTKTLNRHLRKVGLFVACVRPLTPEPTEWRWSVYPLQGGADHVA